MHARLHPTLPSALTIAAIVASVWLLSVATRTLPNGTAYAVWVGIGATGAALLSMLLLKELITLGRGLFLVMLVMSIVGLKLTTTVAAPRGRKSR